MVQVSEARGALLALAIGLSAAGCADSWRYRPAYPLAPARDAACLQAPRAQALLASLVRQQTDTSCSVATTTTLINVVRQRRRLPPLSQAEVVATDPTGSWQLATAAPDSRGITLDKLALLMMQAFGHSGIKRVVIEAVHVRDVSDASRAELTRILNASEAADGAPFVVLNYLQSAYLALGDPVGHMSILGAWDQARGRALVLDVDGRILQPYWVTPSVLLEGMNTADDETGEARGYLVVKIQG